METLTVLVHLLLITVLCCAGDSDIFARFRVHRAKRHSILDQSKLCKAFGCLNGYCKESEMRKYRIVCECFPGYEGKLCDRVKCPFSCGKHGACARKGRTLYCKCDREFTGPKCESQTAPMARVHAMMPKSILKALEGKEVRNAIGVNGRGGWFTPEVKFSEFHSHALVDMSVKPDVCAPGFQCYHGVCDREAMLYEGRFQCLCKKNYMGLFCEKKCTLQCKNGGQCFVTNDGHQLCACPFNYQGHYCEKRIRKG